MAASKLGQDLSWAMIKDYNYAIRAGNAKSDPKFVGLSDTIEQARKIKFDAELAGFIDVAILDGNLNDVF